MFPILLGLLHLGLNLQFLFRHYLIVSGGNPQHDLCYMTLEGNDDTRIEGWVPGAEDLGILGTNITWEVVGLVF